MTRRFDHEKLNRRKRTEQVIRAADAPRRTGAKVFPARYAGTCAFGHDPIEVGQQIAMWASRQPYHPECAIGVSE